MSVMRTHVTEGEGVTQSPLMWNSLKQRQTVSHMYCVVDVWLNHSGAEALVGWHTKSTQGRGDQGHPAPLHDSSSSGPCHYMRESRDTLLNLFPFWNPRK